MQQICSGSTSSIILFRRVLRSSTPEEEGLQHFPYIRMAVVLTQHVRRVLLPFDMEEVENVLKSGLDTGYSYREGADYIYYTYFS